MNGPICALCWRSRRSAASTAPARPRPRSVTSSPAVTMILPSWPGPSAGSGASRTPCIGSSTSPSVRTTAGCAIAPPPAISPFYAKSPSTSSPPIAAAKPAFAVGARRPPGTTTTCSGSSPAKFMREPCLTPEDEDRRRLCRERKVLTAERISHVNRIKGLLFAQGVRDYEPLRRDRRVRLEELRTGDGRCLPVHLKAQISRELDRLEVILVQLKAVDSEGDALLAKGNEDQPPTPASLLVQLKGIGPEFAAVLWSEGLFRSFNNRR